MADKSPHKPSDMKARKTLKEKRAAMRRQRSTGSGAFDTTNRPPSMIRPSPCWYRDPERQPTVGWCPPTCNGPVTHSERAGNGDKLFYCEAHASWRTKTIRLPLVRRLRPGESLQAITNAAPADTRDLAPAEAQVA